MSESVTTFNGRRCTKIKRADPATIGGAVATTAPATFISTSSSVQNSIQSAASSFSRVNAGPAFMSSQSNPTGSGNSASPPMETATPSSTTSMPTGANMPAQDNTDPPDEESDPRQLGAVIGGTVGVIATVLIVLAIFFTMRRWKRRRRVMEPVVQPSSEKEVQIGESPYLDRAPTDPVRTMSIYSKRGVALLPGFRRWHARNHLNFLEQGDRPENPILAQFRSVKTQTFGRLGKLSLRWRPDPPREEEEWRSISSSIARESVTRCSRNARSMDIPNPFADPLQSPVPDSSLGRPTTPHYRSSRTLSKNPRRSMSVPSVAGNNNRIKSFIPSPSLNLPLNFGFGSQGGQEAQISVPPPLHVMPRSGSLPARRNDSMTSQTHSNPANSGSVVILPGRDSTAASSIIEASASDLSRWRMSRSLQDGGIASTRRSDPFDLERPDSGLTGDDSTLEDMDVSSIPSGGAVAVAVSSSRPRLVS
ncbi:hypothetical protein AJ79_02796 [Helicocarpus griseus UAMH5409]|uniref:Uncharacterized protein n=1 Tax=Helicocarpus griseus UAMH5409 TaxID=1447875 RepID=A0A2B7Y0H0_9EURO|nr:hypothetical protein AJ79_02796 [Helicocarpus griseus UAMH5409]